MYGIEELIALAAEKRASDVHLIAGLPPKCRIDGRIETLTDGGLTREDFEEYGRQLAGNAADQIEAIGQLDFSASFAGRRLRVNLFRQQGALSAGDPSSGQYDSEPVGTGASGSSESVFKLE